MPFLIRTIGGPHPGNRVSEGPWPLPDRLEDEGGHYRKIRESQLEEDVSPHVIRGAEYQWEEDS